MMRACDLWIHTLLYHLLIVIKINLTGVFCWVASTILWWILTLLAFYRNSDAVEEVGFLRSTCSLVFWWPHNFKILLLVHKSRLSQFLTSKTDNKFLSCNSGDAPSDVCCCFYTTGGRVFVGVNPNIFCFPRSDKYYSNSSSFISKQQVMVPNANAGN